MLSFVKVRQFIKECSLKIPLIRFLVRIHFVFHVIYLQNTCDSIVMLLCNLRWTEWYWDKLCLRVRYFYFPLSVSFHQYSIPTFHYFTIDTIQLQLPTAPLQDTQETTQGYTALLNQLIFSLPPVGFEDGDNNIGRDV